MGYASRTRDLNEVRDGGFRAYLTFLADRVSGRHWQLACAAGAALRGMMRHHSPRLDPAQVRPAAPLLGPDRPHPQARREREKIRQATNGWLAELERREIK